MTNIGGKFTLAFLIGPAIGGFLELFGLIIPALLASSVASFTLIFTAVFLKESNPLKLGIDPVEFDIKEFTYNASINQESKSLLKSRKIILLLFQYAFIALAAGIFQSTFSLFGFLRFNLSAQLIGLFLSAMGLFQVVFRVFVFNKIRFRLGDTKTAVQGLGSFILA